MKTTTNNQISMKNHKSIIFADRSVKSVKILLKDIRKYPLLSEEEKCSLWESMKQGNMAAREQLINCNMRFVVSMAMQYLWSGVPFEDLIICGSIGLTMAVDRYDPTRGYRFLSFAMWWIKAELHKAVSAQYPYEKMESLDAPLDSDDYDGCSTLLDVIHNNSEKAPDWAVSYLSEMADMKEKARNKHFDEAASILEDAIEMKHMGLPLCDVARKHRVSEGQLRHMLMLIQKELKDEHRPAD